MADRKRSSSKQGGGKAGCLLFLLLLCVVLLVFLVNLGKIKETLARTNFTEIVHNQKTADDKKTSPVSPAPKVGDEPGLTGKAKDSGAVQPPSAGNGVSGSGTVLVPAAGGGSAGSGTQSSLPAAGVPAGGTTGGAIAGGVAGSAAVGTAAGQGGQAAVDGGAGGRTNPASGGVKPALGGKDASKTALIPQRSRGATLYFVRIDDDGVIVRQEVKRQIPASDQPLTDALAALIGGPSEDELRHHLLSLIPQGTKLLSAQVRGSTAYLNFNEAFMYNHYGIEGYAGQLKQIVYTATAFPSVQDVQILIEGERHDYLGGEGVYIGRPLSRNSFER